MLSPRRGWVHNSAMSVTALRRPRILLVTFVAVFAASCGSSSKPAAVTAPSTTSTSSTAPSTVAPTTSTTATTRTTVVGSTTTSTSPSLANWSPPPRAPDGSIPVAAFNARLVTDKPTWARDPQRVAHEFLRTDNIDAASTDTQVANAAPDATELVVTVNGLADDSVHAIRFDVRLARQVDQTWHLDAASWSQQCQPNRGHQNFTTALCI